MYTIQPKTEQPLASPRCAKYVDEIRNMFQARNILIQMSALQALSKIWCSRTFCKNKLFNGPSVARAVIYTAHIDSWLSEGTWWSAY